MSEKPLVKVEHVSKKFCRSLKQSLWYGVKDLAGELTAQNGEGRLQLRPDEFLAVDDVSFELHRGECLGLIGANGAGKSTLLKLLNGLVRPDAGRITVRGRVGALIELGAGFNPILTGRENVYINGAVLGLSKKEIDARFDEIVAFAEIGDFIDAPVQFYSSGMRVRLGFAVAAHLDPDVLLIDEVLAVGDMAFRIKSMNFLWGLLKSSASVIIVSHNMYHIQAFSTRAVFLNKGNVQIEGDPARVVGEYESRIAADTIRISEPETTGPLIFKEIHLSMNDRTLGRVHEWPVLETHQPFRITAQYELRARVSQGIQIGLLVKNSEGHRVAGFTTGRDGEKLPGEPGSYTICFDFTTNLLLNGIYYCDLSSFNMGYTQSLGYWETACKFRVRTPGYNGLGYVGNVFLPHRVHVSGTNFEKDI